MVDESKNHPRLRVVGVGSSAGGLDAVAKLLADAQPTSPWCFILAQHRAPSPDSALVDLISRHTRMTVIDAIDGGPLEGGVVYVSPPGSDIVVEHRVIRLPSPGPGTRPSPNIDRLLITLAEEYGTDSVAVILSGTGHDGSAGAGAIRAAGGVVAVQDPATATFDEMPSSAIRTGAVNTTAPPESLATELHAILFGEPAPEPDSTSDPWPFPPPISEGQSVSSTESSGVELDEAELEPIIDSLHQVTGIDYSGYKRSTLSRQIERRRRIRGVSLTDYAAGLSADIGEAGALARAVLVSVTAFFRDSAVWESLEPRLATLARSLPVHETVRLWVPGCATGEEAYTAAMLAAQALDGTGGELSARLKVFATDLDEAALAVARRGHYSAESITAVPQRLRDRWMYHSPSGWAVIPELRECMVIARHNVAYDPPFPRIHLISLRNTLIYFEPRLQARVMDLCHYALADDGLIVLGLSERISSIDAVFTAVDYAHRIYRRSNSGRLLSIAVGQRPQIPTPRAGIQPAITSSRATSELPYRRILQIMAPPMLILDEREILVEVIGDVSAWCSLGEGRQTGAVIEILRDPYRLAVRTLLGQLRQTGSTTAQLTVDEQGAVRISAFRILAESNTRTAISFQMDTSSGRPDGSDQDTDGALQSLDVNAELDSTQRALESLVADLGTSNEELQAMNEELQASSEELQATTEEAQASNEELEATNEELTTLNQELQARTNEALRANTDLTNIQTSLTSGLIIVDRELRVTRFTPLAVRLFSLIDEDHGRPLTAIPTTVAISGLADDLIATRDDRQSRLREIASESADYLLQTQPYVGSDGAVQGVIVVVTDVGDISSTRRDRDAALNNFHLVANSIRELVWQRDESGSLTFVNSRVEEIYGLDRAHVLADSSLLLSAVHSDDRDRVATISAAAERDWRAEYRIVRPDGSIRWIEEVAQSIRHGDSGPRSIIGSAVDVTDRHRVEAQAAERTAVLDALLGAITAGIVILDREGRILAVSSGFASITRFGSAELSGTPLSMLIDRRAGTDAGTSNSPTELPNDGTFDSWSIVDAHGQSHPISIEFHSVPRPAESATAPRTVAIVHDISRIRAISADLAAREQFDRHTGLLSRQFFRSRTVELLNSSPRGVAALWIDLDGFKEINDRFGHRAGDIVLATVANRLQQAARRHDIVGRLGGDEFAILVTRAEDLDGLEVLAHRILQDIRNPITLADSTAYIAASIGIAVYPGDGSTADQLLHNADTAMYAAKKSGRDRHMYFASNMNSIADKRAAIRHQLGEAFRNNDFELHYQPIVDVATGRATMLEALVRWRFDGRIVPAQEFIDHATQTGHLRALGKIVLKLLDADLATLERELGDNRPRVSVNFSGTELEEREIVDRLITWAPPGGFDKLVIEVTESALLDERGRARDTLGILSRFGANISIDDFGTGYSNLELLDRLEPSIIKIDRTLLQRALAHSRGTNIFNAAVQLAHALDARIIVEGVENQAMWDYLAERDVDMAQGFHIARPMPLDEVIVWLAGSATTPDPS
ncbi:EAL domain-containing protein [Rhodococcoides fascians]|uniref:EAL domain-containing protein n=1 Tax=Rhodococcoides fascians TaxID=1828 RepID=UPI000AC6B109|nr:EAL domain-containing protein [Rhodococcus fascians]